MEYPAIFTKHLPATEYKGVRVKAYDLYDRKPITIGYNYEGYHEGHLAAAEAFIEAHKLRQKELIACRNKEGFAFIRFQPQRSEP